MNNWPTGKMKRLAWTPEMDDLIRTMRAKRASWEQVAKALGVSRWSAVRRGEDVLKVVTPPAPTARPPTEREQAAEDGHYILPVGHPISWGAIANGPYPWPWRA